MDFDVETSSSTTAIDPSWRGYPQNQFGNWTPDQVKRSKMLEKCLLNRSSTIYWMDVRSDGSFATPDLGGQGSTMVVGTENEDGFWDVLHGQQVSPHVFCCASWGVRWVCSDLTIFGCDRYLWMI
jgi:hypothetical protein